MRLIVQKTELVVTASSIDLEMEKSYLDQLFESAQEGIAMAENDHRLRRINSEFTRIFGYTAEEAVG